MNAFDRLYTELESLHLAPTREELDRAIREVVWNPKLSFTQNDDVRIYEDSTGRGYDFRFPGVLRFLLFNYQKPEATPKMRCVGILVRRAIETATTNLQPVCD